jgi:hypothetical protein
VKVADLRLARRWYLPWRTEATRHKSDLFVGDAFRVKRGIATGANDFFILSRDRARELGIPPIALRPILPKERAIVKDIIEPDKDGYPDIEPKLCLITSSLPAAAIATRFPKLHEYLESAALLGVRERTLVRRRNPWYKQEERDPPQFLCTYMGRRHLGAPPLRILWNRSRAVATNTYLMLIPNKELAAHLDKHPACSREVFEMLRTTCRLNLKEGTRVHAGGLHKIEPSELQEVRLAAVPSWLRDVLRGPTRLGDSSASLLQAR